MHRKRYHDFVSKIFCRSVSKVIVGFFLCIRVIMVSKKFIHKQRISIFSFEKFLCHIVENLLWESFSVSECFGYRKSLCIKGGYQDFMWKDVCLTEPNVFVWEPFCVSEYFWYRKNLYIKGGNHEFQSNNFYLTVPKFFIREYFSVSESFLYRKRFCIKRGYHDFLSKIVCPTVSKVFVGNYFVYQNVSGIEKNYT